MGRKGSRRTSAESSSGSRLVYSTERGGTVGPANSAAPGGWSSAGGGPSTKKSAKKSSQKGRRSPSTVPVAPADGVVRVWRQTRGRKGKGVTVLTGLDLDEQALGELAGELKKKCGSGGTVKDRAIEIQGDHRETLLAELRRRGYQAILAGG